MDYDCGDGRHQWITRQQARAIDREQNRRRMYTDEKSALIAANAGYNEWKLVGPTLEKHARYCGCWSMYKCAQGLMHKVVEELARKISVEQICALQHNTHNVYMSIQAHGEPGTACMKTQDIEKLVACARGDLHDEHMEYHKCADCMHCMTRSEWQNCELYHLLLGVPCVIPEEYRLDDSICPYALLKDQ